MVSTSKTNGCTLGPWLFCKNLALESWESSAKRQGIGGSVSGTAAGRWKRPTLRARQVMETDAQNPDHQANTVVRNWSYQVDVEVYLRIPVWIHHRIYIYIFFFSNKITGCNWIFNNSWNCLSSLRRFQDAECERRSSLGFHSLRLPTHHVTLWAPWLASKSIGSRNSIRHFSKDAWNVTIKRWFKTSTFFRCQMKSVSLEVDTPSRCECKMPLHRERCFNGLYVSELPISRKSLKPPGPNLDSGDHLLGSASKWDKKKQLILN